ncbi:sensor histidine kinase [Streptomyces flavofungini]|uniref:sensor histidine kinase n=1 Tax=Streptomyces flavofungini TaxID=68200 RepID=UPI0025AFBCF3|nr:histidine kinase [Streptomyces flavofungini]WJV46574.1 histidine kinase [Streptomyces flavofungini]
MPATTVTARLTTNPTHLKALLTLTPRPLPPLTWPRPLRYLPHTLVGLAALALSATGADLTARLLAVTHAATLLLALRRPAPAFWLSLACFAAISLGHPPTHDNEVWAWVVHASTLFLLALRVPPLPAATATALSAALGAALKLLGAGVGSWPTVATGTALYATALLSGAIRRGRREDRARLAEQIEATAAERARRTVLEERARIARELHDVVAHHMSLISIQADAAPYRVQDPPRELVTELASIRANALEGLAELRRLLGLLRAEAADGAPADTTPQPSLDQLDALLSQVRAAGLPVSARVTGARRALPPGVELSAYRIVQEALSNTLRHAPGAPTAVELGYGRGTLTLRVTNGPAAGTAPPSPGAGHGLTGMRERVTMLDGDFAAGPTPEGGYEVTAALPTRTAPAPPPPASSRTDKDSPA